MNRLKTTDTPEVIPAAGAPALQIRDLRKVYRSRRRGDVVAVEGVTFDVASGEIVGLLGPNGAGKTTTIKTLCTLIRPTSGSIVLGGVDAVRQPRLAVRKVAAVLEGNRNIFWRFTVRENLEYFAALHGLSSKKVRGYVGELTDRFDLSQKSDTTARMLSRGMQQKLAVACAFIKQTPVLLLDEPTLGLDVETSHELRDLLKHMAEEQGRTILLSSHDMDVVQDVCERVIIINEGRIVTDDRVSNLLELFRATAYTVVVIGSLGDECASQLRSRFPMLTIESEGATSIVEVDLLDGAGFYELIDVLRGCDVLIESVNKKDPDLEEVFIKIVKGGS